MFTNHQILLSTAVVQVSNADRCPTVVLAIKLTEKQINMPVYGISKNVTTIKHKVVATVKSRITTNINVKNFTFATEIQK
jgi:predicted secreted protein